MSVTKWRWCEGDGKGGMSQGGHAPTCGNLRHGTVRDERCPRCESTDKDFYNYPCDASGGTHYFHPWHCSPTTGSAPVQDGNMRCCENGNFNQMHDCKKADPVSAQTAREFWFPFALQLVHNAYRNHIPPRPILGDADEVEAGILAENLAARALNFARPWRERAEKAEALAARRKRAAESLATGLSELRALAGEMAEALTDAYNTAMSFGGGSTVSGPFFHIAQQAKAALKAWKDYQNV